MQVTDLDLDLQLEDIDLELECLFPRQGFKQKIKHIFFFQLQEREMLSKKIFEVLQHNPDQDSPQVSECFSGSKYKSSLQIHQQRRQKICRSVPTRNIQKH